MTDIETIKAYQTYINVPVTGIFDLDTQLGTGKFYGLNAKELAYLLGQCYVETGNFKKFTEKTTWSAKTMGDIFAKRFLLPRQKLIKSPKNYTPETLALESAKVRADFIYANINGNGDYTSEDGSRFIGRGAIQLTGRSNYQKFADYLADQTIMTDPDQVAGKHFMASAIYFCKILTKTSKSKSIFEVANSGEPTLSLIEIVTGKVNAKKLDLAGRQQATLKYYKTFKNADLSPASKKTEGIIVSGVTNQPIKGVEIEIVEAPPSSLTPLPPKPL